MTHELEPMAPAEALDLYLTDKQQEYADSTIRSHGARLKFFVEWCEANGVDNLNDLTGRQLREFRIWRRNDGDLSPPSEKGQMDTLRVFIRWAESLDAVPQGLHHKVSSPSLDPEDDVRETMLDADQADKALQHLDTYEYASVRHVTLAFLWHTMARKSAARALDVDDYDSAEQYVELHHRPETDTPLKNGEQGERFVALSEGLCEIIDDYLQNQRPDVVDDYGREPLLATEYGRPASSTIQQYVYQLTRPCWYGEPCPEERDPEACDAAQINGASKCPASESPHAVRRGSITHSLREGVPKPVVGDRASVSERVLDQHYDQRSAKEKMEKRREQLDKL